MREITRTLKTRLPILAISITCGCALNFGQVKVDGTLNATADTKIDTTVNATASVTQNPTATPIPTATPTPGPGTLYVHHVPKLSGPDSSLGYYSLSDAIHSGPVAYIYLEASRERTQIITFTRLTQEGTLPVEPAAFVDLTYSGEGGSLRIDGTSSGAANFVKESGFMVIPAGKTHMAVMSLNRAWAYPYGTSDKVAGYNYNLFNNNFLGKNVRFTILKPTDITTLSGAKVEGDFPLQGPLISF